MIPAIGCTEPIAVALCVAKAVETLGTKPENIKVFLSANILKNAMGGRYSWNGDDRFAYRLWPWGLLSESRSISLKY